MDLRHAVYLGLLLLIPVSAHAQFNLGATPYALRYADCVYSSRGDVTTNCGKLKKILILEAGPVLDHLYPDRPLQVKRSFAGALSVMEKDALDRRRDKKTLHPFVMSYLNCLAQFSVRNLASAQGYPTFDGRAANKNCAAERKTGSDMRISSREDLDAKNQISNIYKLVDEVDVIPAPFTFGHENSDQFYNLYFLITPLH